MNSIEIIFPNCLIPPKDLWALHSNLESQIPGFPWSIPSLLIESNCVAVTIHPHNDLSKNDSSSSSDHDLLLINDDNGLPLDDFTSSEDSLNHVHIKEHQTIESIVVQPETIEPIVVQPEPIESIVVQPEPIKSNVADTETIVVQPETIEPIVVQPETIEPIVADTETIEPIVVQPEPIKSNVADTEPIVADTETIESIVVQPETIVVQPKPIVVDTADRIVNNKKHEQLLKENEMVELNDNLNRTTMNDLSFVVINSESNDLTVSQFETKTTTNNDQENNDLFNYTVVQLRNMCKTKGISTKGNKSELVSRLVDSN